MTRWVESIYFNKNAMPVLKSVFSLVNSRIFLIFFFIFVVFNGCRNTKKQIIENSNGGVTNIIIPEVRDARDVDIIYDLNYIILEEKENSYLGNVAKMRVYQNRIYILDQHYARALFIYSIGGKHITTIGSEKGHGPFDFVSVSNFEIDYINNQLLVMDNLGYKFMIYDLDGNFIKRIGSKIPVTNAVLLPNGYIVHAKSSHDYQKGNSCIIITDNDQQIIKEGFEYDDNGKLNIQIFDIIRSSFDKSFTFAPKFRDTIYSVSFNSITPKYAINYGVNRKISDRLINELTSLKQLFDLIDAGNMCYMGNHVESNDFLYLSMGSYSTHVFYNKHINSTIAISSKANIPEYEYWLYKILCSDSEGYFYGAFNIANIDELSKLFPELQKLDLPEDINPILFRYKVKI